MLVIITNWKNDVNYEENTDKIRCVECQKNLLRAEILPNPISSKTASAPAARAPDCSKKNTGKPAVAWRRLGLRVSPVPHSAFGESVSQSDKKFTGKRRAFIQSKLPAEPVAYTKKSIDRPAPQKALKNRPLHHTLQIALFNLEIPFLSFASLYAQNKCFCSHLSRAGGLILLKLQSGPKGQSSPQEPAGQAAASFRGKSCCLNAGCRALRQGPGCSLRFCRRRNSSWPWIRNG